MVVLVFSFWGKPHCLHSGCTDIHFHQHRTRVSFSLHPPQHFLLVFLITATWQVWGSTSLWSWFSNPWWGDVEHLFICLLAICVSSFQKCLFRALPHFKIGFWVFFPIHSMSPLAILDIYLFSDVYHLLISSPTQQVAFFLCDGFPWCVKAFSFDELPFVYFCFRCSCLRRHVKKTIAKTYVNEHTAYVFFWELYGLCSNNFVFNLLLLWFISECCVKKWGPGFHNLLLKRQRFPWWMFSAPLS